MGAQGDVARDRLIRVDRERLRALNTVGQPVAMAQDETSHAIGKGCLADALRAPDQPGVRDAPALVGIEQGALGLAMPKQLGSLARMWRAELGLGLLRAHARLAKFAAGAARKRSRSATQTRSATV